MKLNRASSGVEFYCFDNLQPCSGLMHGVFTRSGGVSEGRFGSLNVGLSTGDEKDRVLSNRKKISDSMGISTENTLYLSQVHGRDFVILRKDECCNCDGKPDLKRCGIGENVIREADGFVTDMEGILTVMQVADCQAVILYDPVKRVISNIHSGWRGSIQDIIGIGVEIMVDQFGSDPAAILASVAPSLGPCCAEFKNYQIEIPEKFWNFRIDEFHFDFWEITKNQLTSRGVLPENIEVAGICTTCSSETFFSYRKENVTGRFAVAAALI